MSTPVRREVAVELRRAGQAPRALLARVENADDRIALGALLEIGLVITNLGHRRRAVPIVRRYSETPALS